MSEINFSQHQNRHAPAEWWRETFMVMDDDTLKEWYTAAVEAIGSEDGLCYEAVPEAIRVYVGRLEERVRHFEAEASDRNLEPY